jgi:hypothetical protein
LGCTRFRPFVICAEQIEGVDDFQHFEVGARNRFVFANAAAAILAADILIGICVFFVGVPVLSVFIDFLFDFREIRVNRTRHIRVWFDS